MVPFVYYLIALSLTWEMITELNIVLNLESGNLLLCRVEQYDEQYFRQAAFWLGKKSSFKTFSATSCR